MAESADGILQAFEGRFDEIIDQLHPLALATNRGRNNDRRRLRDEVAQGHPINRPIPTHHRRQPVYSDDSEEKEDFLFGQHQPARGGGKYGWDYEKDSRDFKLRVDIPFFSGNLNIEVL